VTGPTRRGRPRSGDTSDRRTAILDAARSQFAARGFAGTSMRSIATQAGVDVSLISHYFGGKDALLVATMQLPVDPVEKISDVITGGTDGLAERLLRTFLDAWDPHREVFSTLIRTTLGSGDPHAPLLQVARNILIVNVASILEGDDRDLRATLVASELIGMAAVRYVMKLEPLASAGPDDIVRLYAPGIQRLIDGSVPLT
jgi:AcrR family transcriptional regulator